MNCEIFDKLQTAIKDAMIGGLPTKRDCLRGVISEIKNQTINAGKDMTDEICLSVIRKSVKQHNESIDQAKMNKREDIALKESEELTYLEEFLPNMLSEDHVKDIVSKVISANSIELTKKNFGRIMKELNSHPDSALIDRKFVSSYLNRILK